MNCDNCNTEFDGPVVYSECPECGADLDVRVNYKTPVEQRGEDDG